jgi:hypothetical protein
MGLGVEIDEGEVSPFGEVVGLVGGWEEKMRSATAWAVVNTTNPGPFGTEAIGVEESDEEGRKSRGVDVSA